MCLKEYTCNYKIIIMVEMKIDKELLRLRLESQGYDTTQMDMDLAVEYEKVKIATEILLWPKTTT